jgi:hypothetical protein
MKSPLTVYIDQMAADIGIKLYTVSVAAEMVGKSADTLTRWRKLGYVNAPSQQIDFEKQTVYLYTDEDIRELKEFAKSMYQGRRMDLEGA